MIKIVMMIKMAMMNGHYGYGDHMMAMMILMAMMIMMALMAMMNDHDGYDDQMMAMMII